MNKEAESLLFTAHINKKDFFFEYKTLKYNVLSQY
jgi:hypothetical protein